MSPGPANPPFDKSHSFQEDNSYVGLPDMNELKMSSPAPETGYASNLNCPPSM